MPIDITFLISKIVAKQEVEAVVDPLRQEIQAAQAAAEKAKQACLEAVANLEERFLGLENRVLNRVLTLEAMTKKLEENVEMLDARVRGIEEKIERLDGRSSTLLRILKKWFRTLIKWLSLRQKTGSL